MLLDGLSNEQTICLVLAGFYLYESLVWIPSGATALVSRWGKQYAPLGGRIFRVGDKGGLAISSLLPTASTLLTESYPIKLAPSGLLIEGSHGRPDSTFYDYESLGEIAVDHTVVLAGERPLCKLGSPLAANQFADLIKSLVTAAPNEREEILERSIENATDEQLAEQRRQCFLEVTPALRVLSVIFFASTIAVGLLGAWVEWSWIRMPGNFVLVLLTWLVLWLAIVIKFRAAQRLLYPANPVFRRQRMLAFLVSPVCAMRAADLLARDLMFGRHPLAVAKACCSARDFRELARRSLLELMYPTAHSSGRQQDDVRDWFDARMLAALTKLVQRSGEDLGAIVSPPEPLGADAHAYCPRCEMQFARQAGECNVCGVTLEQFNFAVA